MSRQPDLSVIVCSYNGADGIGRCLSALTHQTGIAELDIVVVDDGSTDRTADVAGVYEVRVIRHPRNQGVSAARNTGLRQAAADIVAFLDDDCDPAPDWASRLLARYALGSPGPHRTERILGVGGALPPASMDGLLHGFLQRHNPLRPLNLNLAQSEALAYRLARYLQAQWTTDGVDLPREVFSLAGGSMSFWKDDLISVGMLDERLTFGGEDLDLCRRLAGRFPHRPLVYDPAVTVTHHFEPDLRDTLRRSRAYARGAAHLCRKWPTMKPTLFPVPLLAVTLLAAAARWPTAAAAAALLPYAVYGRWLPHLRRTHDPRCLIDPWISLAQETYGNLGFAEGAWRHRHTPREQNTVAVGRYRDTPQRQTAETPRSP